MTRNDWVHPIFQDILRSCQRQYDRQEPEIEDETLDAEEIERRETEYLRWLDDLRHDVRPKVAKSLQALDACRRNRSKPE